MAKKLCSHLRCMAEEQLFVQEGDTKVWHVLHDREEYPLMYWYCLDPTSIPGLGTDQCLASAFDIRNFPAEIVAGLDIQVRSSSDVSWEDARRRERLGHAEAIRRAVLRGYDILAGEWAAQQAEAERERERRARLAAQPDDPDFPF